MTLTAQWKVGVSLAANRWMYIGMSWSELQGLYLFCNGMVMTHTTVSTPQNQVPTSRASPNLVFGSSLTQTGFAKFYLASFTTFKTFMSQSVMYSVYTFYWRIGSSVPSSGIAFINVKLSNQAGTDILITSSDKMPANGLRLAKGLDMTFLKELPGVNAVTFTAKGLAAGQMIYLNGKASLTLSGSSLKGTAMNIIATTSASGVGVSRYYVVLKVSNKVGSGILLRATDGIPGHGFSIAKGFIVVIKKLTNSVTPVGFSASDLHGNQLLLNGKDKLIVHPSISEKQPMVVDVQKFGVKGGMKYYLTLQLLNKAGSDIILKSSDRNPSSGFKIKQGLKVQITKTTPSLQPVMFTAFNSKGSALILNDKHDIVLRPSPNKGNPFILQITPPAGARVTNTYFTTLKIKNTNSGSIILKSSDNYPSNGYLIKAKTAVLIKKKSPSSISVDYWVIDSQTKRRLVLNNGRKKVTLRPHMIQPSPVDLVVSATAVQGSKKAAVAKPSKITGSIKSTSKTNLPIYYLVLKVANRAGYDATIVPDDSQPPQFQVKKGYLEIVTKKSHSNLPVKFRAVKSGTNEALNINGQESLTLLPSSMKGKPFSLNLQTKGNISEEVKIMPVSKTPYYVNLHVNNKFPGDSIFLPANQSPETGFHLNSGATMNIHEIVEGNSPLTYIALGAKDHDSLLINNQSHLMVTPASVKTLTTPVEIEKPSDPKFNTNALQKDCRTTNCAVSQPPQGIVHYITLIIQNKLGRAARVIPSKGKSNGYLISPHSYRKVNLIIKSRANVSPITFRAEDVETKSKLLLNKILWPISVAPSDSPDTLTNLTITAEPPQAKPLQSWSFSSYDGTSITGNPPLSVNGQASPVDDGVHFDGSTNYAETNLSVSNCLHDPERCSRGLSFGAKLRVGKAALDYTEPRFIVDSGGHTEKTRGVALFVENKRLVAEVTTHNMKYRASTTLTLNQWMYVTVTFKHGLGLSLYYNGELGNLDNTGVPVAQTQPLDTPKNLMIGRNINGPPYNHAAFDIASLTVFNDYLTEEDVNRVYLFFWSGKSAKIFYATLRVLNGAGRAVVLKPDKGKPGGFAIKPGSTEDILLLSMSTDENPIEPVKFHAIDAETSTKLMINHFIRPFVVVPKETRTDIQILITAPAPSVYPKYIWNFKNVDTGTVRDSSPKLMVHGFYQAEGDSLRLLPGDTWIEAGDYKAKCISDPQMCDEGMALAIKLKFNEEAKNYTDEPRFLLDSGAHDPQSRGFSMFYQDKALHCVVAISNAEWKVSTPISLHEWKYVMFTWKMKEGLSFYINGHLRDQMKHQINKPGLHHADKFTKFEIARNSAGPPYGNAQFTINSLAFFDEHVSKAEALRDYIYFWGNGMPAFSNRYIKVRMDNKAGTNVKITPSRGGAKDQGYSIKPHMSLELSFVAKGASANAPVTFRAQDELTGDALLINSSEEPYAVSPSDLSTKMTIAIVTSSIKCLSPDGQFSDPTNEYGYINCTAGSASRVSCDPGMKWEDETKSCQRKGGLPTLYYASLQLHNNAGKDVGLLESEGNEPPHLITKGETRKVKLIGHEEKHYKFEVVDNTTGESLVLNNQPFTTLVLGDDPDKIIDITISNPSHYYTVTTHTGVQPDAGTDANVYIKLFGDQGATEELPLKHVGAKEFQPGQLDTFRIPALDIGKIRRVVIKHDGAGRSPSWFLNKVTVSGDNQHNFEFPFYDWLKNQEGVQGNVEREILLHHGKRTCIPPCKNGGECIEGKCQCPTSFEGLSCERALCPIPCKNGGKCFNPTTNECRCAQGYQGQYCENAVCTSRCLNGGLCIGPNRCTCQQGYSGLRCEISSCKPDCINGGRCTNDGKCECSAGFSGEYCQIEHTCELALNYGPCFDELKRELEQGKADERSLGCSEYLSEVLTNCHVHTTSYSQAECEKQCDPASNSVCSRIWNPVKCASDKKRYRFNPQTRSCEEFSFAGCLGNNNNFVSEAACNQACGMVGTSVRRKRSRNQSHSPWVFSSLRRTV